MPTLDSQTAAAVFAAAATSTDWRRTNRGQQVRVSHGSDTYYVEIDSSGRYFAQITAWEGYGGTEYVQDANADLDQHRALAAQANTHAP
ncbi:hypothetical protein [Streptomyces sp. NPDC088915]|uniref:hypothetical protein n=1 Tax=Streptomyces sp. NPDC088915 TaxID=3365912 RepID=UPI0037F1E642